MDGTVAFRHRYPPVIVENIAITPYLVKRTAPWICLGIFDESAGGVLEHFTYIPLAHVDYVNVENDELSTLPGLVEEWEGPSYSPTPLPDELKPVKDRKTFVFNICTRRLQGFELVWYGNDRADMSGRSKQVLDLFSGELKDLQLDVLMTSNDKKSFGNAKLFQQSCNEINKIRHGKGARWQPAWQKHAPKKHPAPRDKSLLERLNPKNPESPLYIIMGPGSPGYVKPVESVEEYIGGEDDPRYNLPPYVMEDDVESEDDRGK